MTTAIQPEVPEGRDADAAQSAYPAGTRPVFAPGAQVRIRHEQWLVKSVSESRDGLMVEVSGVSSFVRGTDAIFYSGLDVIEVLDPRKTELVPDETSKHAKRVSTWRRSSARPRCRRPSTASPSPTPSSWTGSSISCAPPSWPCPCAIRSPGC